MNFFAHQDRARRNTLLLIGLFLLAVIAIVIAVNLVVGLAFGLLDSTTGSGPNTGAWVGISFATLALIGGATTYRVSSLGGGGSVVAEAMNGTPVPPDTTDPQLRRLRNVVEEIALASGVATPAIYVMEDEQGINAFAAGYAPTDAAVAVTRGTLNHLNRDELQGVIAHEFSHIVNGDMRLNIRLMGVLFGILVIGVIGRFLLRSGGRARIRSSGSRNNRGGVMALGLALMVIGYVGVFFGRLIKAGVSRQREFLADASAVQFTRQPQGIAGALKKIAALNRGSRLRAADTEEVSHMLFANGVRSFSRMLATHPPLESRIRAIEPNFRTEEIEELARALARREAAAAAVEKSSEKDEPRGFPGALPGLGELPGMGGGAIPGAVLTGAVLADLEQPDPERLQQAGALIDSIPQALYEAVHEVDGVVPALLVLLLGADSATRAQGLAHLDGRISAPARARVDELLEHVDRLTPMQRLPLLELAVPALRRRSPESLKALLPLVEELIHLDGKITVFEYALGRLLAKHVDDILQPRRALPGGRRRLRDCHDALVDLFSVLAHHGHADEASARQAFTAGIAKLLPMNVPDYRPPEAWVAALDRSLAAVDGLELLIKQGVIEGLATTVTHDGEVTVAEAELLRVICACLHVPVPPILPTVAPPQRSRP